jgi:hypothetical protein
MNKLYYFLSFMVVLSFSCSKDSQMNPDQNIVMKLNKGTSVLKHLYPGLTVPPGLVNTYKKNGNKHPLQQWLNDQTSILEKVCLNSTDCAVKAELVDQLIYIQKQLDILGCKDVESKDALCDGYLSEVNTYVDITPEILRLKIGETQPLEAKIIVGTEICTGEIEWGNPYDDISTVDKDGNVTGVNVGSGRIGAWVVGLQYISGEEGVEVYDKPEVMTNSVADIHATSAKVGGYVINDNNDLVIERGVFWGTSEDPQLTGTKLQIGSGTGSYSTFLLGLNPDETYHVIAYAINSAGISYGNPMSFNTGKPQSQIILTIQDATSWTPENHNLSIVPDAIAKLYQSQASFDSGSPDYTATSDVNGIVNFYVPNQTSLYYLVVEKGDLSNIKDGWVIIGVIDNDEEYYSTPYQPGKYIGGVLLCDFSGDAIVGDLDQIGHDIIYVYENQTTTKTIIIGK